MPKILGTATEEGKEKEQQENLKILKMTVCCSAPGGAGTVPLLLADEPLLEVAGRPEPRVVAREEVLEGVLADGPAEAVLRGRPLGARRRWLATRARAVFIWRLKESNMRWASEMSRSDDLTASGPERDFGPTT